MTRAADVFASLRENNPEQALEAVTQVLAADGDLPYFLVQRALLIQVAESVGRFTLEDAEEDLNRAHMLDQTFLAALEELAHFYDAVNPDRDKARHFARLYLEQTREPIAAMKKILGTSEA